MFWHCNNYLIAYKGFREIIFICKKIRTTTQNKFQQSEGKNKNLKLKKDMIDYMIDSLVCGDHMQDFIA